MSEKLQKFQDFLVSQFGESILEPLYKGLGQAGAFIVVAKLVAAGISAGFDVDFPEVVGGPIRWQLFIAILLVVSHAQPDIAKLDRQYAQRFWASLIIETLAITTSLICVGLLVVYIDQIFPLTFCGLSLMLFSIMIRRVLTDSTKPLIQLLRFSSAIWFLFIGAAMYVHGNEMNWKIELFSWTLLALYFVLIFRRRPSVEASGSQE